MDDGTPNDECRMTMDDEAGFGERPNRRVMVRNDRGQPESKESGRIGSMPATGRGGSGQRATHYVSGRAGKRLAVHELLRMTRSVPTSSTSTAAAGWHVDHGGQFCVRHLHHSRGSSVYLSSSRKQARGAE